MGVSATACLDDNNAYDFFALVGDLIHLGPTDTNVGDVQILLMP
jgi:hydroxypyruvate reductase